MKRIGLFSDSHEGANLETICNLFKNQNVDSTWFFGDGLYKTQAPTTLANSRTALQLKRAFLSNTSLREDLVKGYFSEAQIQKIVQDLNTGKKTSDTISKAQGKQLNDNFPNLELAVAGNHDQKAFVEELNHLNGETKNIAGLNVYGCSGGGSIPNTAFFDEDLLADNQETGKYAHQQWQQGLATVKDMDIIAMHAPYTFDDDFRKEMVGEAALQALVQRTKIAQEHPEVQLPQAIIHGHLHSEATWQFRKIKDEQGEVILETLVGTPGVSSEKHNFKPFSSACIAEIDEISKRILRVHEYRIYNSCNGLKDVELHGTHEIDHENKKVNFTQKNEPVISEKDLKKFTDHLQLDPHYALTKQGFNTNYENLNPKEKDQLLKQNLVLAEHFAEDVAQKLKKTINEVRRNHLKENHLDTQVMSKTVRDQFIAKIAAEEGIDFTSLESPFERKMFENAYLQTRFGLQPGIINSALHMDDPTNIAKQWGAERELINHVQKKAQEINEEIAYEGITEKDFHEMIETYLPQNFTFAKELEFGEYQNLYNAARQQGLFGTQQVKEMNDWFKEKPGSLNPYTNEQIQELFGSPIEETIPEEETTPDPKEMIEQLLQRGVQPLKDDQGDYFPTPRGKEYINPEMKKQIPYEAKTLAEAIADGSYQIVNDNGKEILVDTNLGLGSEFEDQGFSYETITPQEYHQQQMFKALQAQQSNQLEGQNNPLRRPTNNPPY